MRIIYHGHSGFSVRTQNRLLVFDYTGGGLNAPESADRAIVFVSHAHGDHYDPLVAQWAQEGRALLVTGDDVNAGGVKMRPGERFEPDGVEIRAFASTDQGVSFYVRADGWGIFHAGDLNLWHWRHESDEEEIREAEEAFEAAIRPMCGLDIDVAFFPTDPRMGEGFEEGAVRFAEAVRPKRLVPMHFWDHPEAAYLMKEKETGGGTRVCVMTVPGEELVIDEERTMRI